MTSSSSGSNQSAAVRVGRRAFFRSALLGGGVAVAAVASGAAGGSGEAPGPRPAAPGRGRGYRETPAIRRYYRLARQI